MPTKGVVDWRHDWVAVFDDLCNPLYRFVCLPNPELNGFSFEYHRFLSEYEESVTCHYSEKFCSETVMNHLLDSDVGCFVVSDCLATFASLVERICTRGIAQSFQFQRFTRTRLMLAQVLFREGQWPGQPRRSEPLARGLQARAVPCRPLLMHANDHSESTAGHN